MINIENFDQFVSDLEYEIKVREEAWERVYGSYVNIVLREILMTSPQFSGNFTANWRLQDGSPEYKYEEQRIRWHEDEPFKMGDLVAVETAYIRESLTVSNYPQLKDVYYITNDTPYGAEIAENRLEIGDKKTVTHLRPGNYVNPLPIPLGHVRLMAAELFERVKQ